MLIDLTTSDGLYALSLFLILSFFIAYSVDTIMGRHGFGIWGNMLIVNVQCQLSLWLTKTKVAQQLSSMEHMIAALAFTFASIVILSLGRSIFLKN